MNEPTSVPDLTDDVEQYIRERVELEVRSAVPEAVAHEEERRFRQLKWMIALVGLVGLGTFGTLSNYLIEKAVEMRLESRTGNISDSLEFVRFSSLALKIDMGNSFSKEDRSAIMNYLRRTATNERVRHTEEFNAALIQVMNSFTQAGLSSNIDEICQLYERELLTTDTLIEILLHHYGQEIVHRPATPKDDFALKMFERLESLAQGAKVPELAQAYRTLFLHKQNPGGPHASVLAAIERAEMNDLGDLTRYFREMLVRTNADNWQRRSNVSGVAFQQVARSFFSTYSSALATRTGVEVHLLKQAAADGVKGDEIEFLAISLASGAKRPKPVLPSVASQK